MIADARSSALAGGAADEADQIRPDMGGMPSPSPDLLPGAVAAPDPEASVTDDAEHASAAAPTTILSRLGGAVIDGLVHCACSHQSVHPDLLILATGEIPGLEPHRSEAGEDDAG